MQSCSLRSASWLVPLVLTFAAGAWSGATPPATVDPEYPGVLTGAVRDAAGRPVAGATVWAVCTTYGLRAMLTTRQTTTGPDGAYRVEGVPAPGNSSTDGLVGITLAAWKAGRPPALGNAVVTGGTGVAPDLVFPSKGAALRVRVVAPDGRPAAGVAVEAAPDLTWAIVPSPFYRGNENREESAALRRALAPRAVTDPAGNARFDHLLPGRYALTAVRADPRDDGAAGRDVFATYHSSWSRGMGREVAYAGGVPVAPAGESRYGLRLQKDVGRLRVRLLLPDGTPVRESGMGLWIDPASVKEDGLNTGGPFSSGSEVKDVFDFTFSMRPGLWRVTARLRDAPPYTTADREPMLVGQTVIAHSPHRERSEALDISTARVGPGRLALRVVDESGRPVRGTATLERYNSGRGEKERRTAATDEDGRVIFTDLASGETTVRFEAAGDAPLPEMRRSAGDPFPPDAALTNRRLWPAVTIAIRPEAETRATLRATRVGWLRGRGRGAAQGWLSLPMDLERTMGTGERYDRKTGEYLIGPLPPGPFALSFRTLEGEARQTVSIAPGRVAHLDFAPAPRPSDFSRAEAERPRRFRSLTGAFVFLPDGRTPAAGARVLIFDPALPYGVQGRFWADGRGRLQPAGFAEPPAPYTPPDAPPAHAPTGGPKKPVAVVLLPGSHGAVFVPLPPPREGSALRLLLPPALSVRGRVTIEGRPAGRTPGAVRVLAACTGQGRLNDLLSVETTVENDGSFVLAGLTPGRYVVQATCDDIWFSRPATVTVRAGGALPALSLALPEPGKPLAVDLGRRRAGVRARLTDPLPAGPLSDRRRPAFYVADGAGRLRLEGLPAGRHRLRLPDGRIIAVTIAPFPD